MPLKLFDPARAGMWRGLVEHFLDHLSTRAERGFICLRECRDKGRYARSFADHFAGEEPKNADVIGWLNAHPEWKSAHTIANATASVIACVQWLADNDYVAKCRLKKKLLGLPRVAPRTAFTLRDVAIFLRAIKYAHGSRKSKLALRCAVWFLARTGCRTCEMRNLRWQQIDWDRGIAVMRTHKTAKRTGEDRVIVLPRVVIRLLFWRRRESGHVFLNSRGRKWDAVGFARLFRRYLAVARMAHLGVTPYSIRHGFAAACLDAGIRDVRVAKLLGHKSTKLIAYYGSTAKKKIGRLRRCVDHVAKRPRR